MSKKFLDDTGVSDLVNSIATNVANKYATKDEIITANGGNADTLDGLHASDFSQIIDFGHNETDTKVAVGQAGKTTIYRCVKWTDYPTESPDGQGIIIAVNYNGAGTAGTDGMWVDQFFISARTGFIYKRHIGNTTVGNWEDYRDGGNADTVDGMNAWTHAVLNSDGYFEGNDYICFTDNAYGDGRYNAWTPSGKGVRVDYANNSANAETVGGYPANILVRNYADGNPLKTSINECFVTGTYAIEAAFTPNFPTGYGTYGFLDVRAYGSICYQTVRFENGVIINRAAIVGQTNWSSWQQLRNATMSTSAPSGGSNGQIHYQYS